MDSVTWGVMRETIESSNTNAFTTFGGSDPLSIIKRTMRKLLVPAPPKEPKYRLLHVSETYGLHELKILCSNLIE